MNRRGSTKGLGVTTMQACTRLHVVTVTTKDPALRWCAPLHFRSLPCSYLLRRTLCNSAPKKWKTMVYNVPVHSPRVRIILQHIMAIHVYLQGAYASSVPTFQSICPLLQVNSIHSRSVASHTSKAISCFSQHAVRCSETRESLLLRGYCISYSQVFLHLQVDDECDSHGSPMPAAGGLSPPSLQRIFDDMRSGCGPRMGSTSASEAALLEDHERAWQLHAKQQPQESQRQVAPAASQGAAALGVAPAVPQDSVYAAQGTQQQQATQPSPGHMPPGPPTAQVVQPTHTQVMPAAAVAAPSQRLPLREAQNVLSSLHTPVPLTAVQAVGATVTQPGAVSNEN